MKYEIIGSTMPAVEVTLSAGEAMYTQSGGMAWQTEGIAMETNTKGGLMKGLGRMLAGESLFMATYKAEREGAMVAFASTVPGEIVPVDVTQLQLICQKGAFLCAEEGVVVNTVLTKKFSSGLVGGEGFILQELAGSGTAFLEIDGDKIVKELAPGEVLKVDTGNVVAFEKSVSYEVETVKGLKNIFLGGEGLFLTRLVGPGKVIL
ncbi:MAG: TIGR00266 family protein [Lachnospiraceae bacterium]|nr:TIGR00266 family protein [Lachnospiraceae bacterium]